MIVVLTTDLYLVEWPFEANPPEAGGTIATDAGTKTILKVMRNDGDERGVPRWATVLRAELNASVEDEELTA